MNRNIVYLVITTALLGIFYLVCRVWLRDIYLFGWMAHNWMVPLCIWIVVLVLILAGRPIPAFTVTGGHLLATVVGQYLGDWLVEQKIAGITPDMDPGQAAQLHNHNGFFLWVMILVVSLAAGIAADVIIRKKAPMGGGK